MSPKLNEVASWATAPSIAPFAADEIFARTELAANVGAIAKLSKRSIVVVPAAPNGGAAVNASVAVTTCHAYVFRLSAPAITLAKTRSPAVRVVVAVRSWNAFMVVVAVGINLLKLELAA